MASERDDSTQGIFRTIGVSVALLFREHLHLVRTTLEIARSRFDFGQKIENTNNELGKALAYLTESLLVATIVIKLSFGGGSPKSHLLPPEFPLSEELGPLVFSLFVIYQGIGGYWIACIFSRQRIPPAATLAAYAYWIGFIQIFIPIVFLNMAMFPNGEAGLSGLSELLYWIYLSAAGLVGVFLLVSLLFLFRWIASIHKITFLKAFAAYLIGTMVTLLPLAIITLS